MNTNFHTQLIKRIFAAGLMLSAVVAPAAAMPVVPGFSQVDNNQLLTDVQYRGRGMTQHWDQRMHGNRCRVRIGNCNHYHNGYYYQTPWWTLPLVIGGAIAGQQIFNNRVSHVRWCESRYRSYDRRSDTWLGNDGQRHRCVSPN